MNLAASFVAGCGSSIECDNSNQPSLAKRSKGVSIKGTDLIIPRHTECQTVQFVIGVNTIEIRSIWEELNVTSSSIDCSLSSEFAPD